MPITPEIKEKYGQLTSEKITNGILTFEFKEPSDGAIGSGKLIITDPTSNSMVTNYSIHTDENNTVKLNLSTNDKILIPQLEISSSYISGTVLSIPFKEFIAYLKGNSLTVIREIT